MRQLVLDIEESRFNLFLQFLKTLDYVRIQPAGKPQNNASPKPGRYDFSDLAGKLEWAGNAVIEQRRLRDEW